LKVKTQYKCANCGNIQAKWMGKCTQCGEWDSFVAETVGGNSGSSIQIDNRRSKSTEVRAYPLSEIHQSQLYKIQLEDKELNRILGDGMVPGSAILLGGEPGIGKSTLLLQIAYSFKDAKILYVAGEESIFQIKHRAERLNLKGEQVLFLSENNLEDILSVIQTEEPAIVIVDSIQTVYSRGLENSPGSLTQIRECAAALIQITKPNNISLFLIGHITKDGNIAGPKVLEHIVDTVLYFEGEKENNIRLLRTFKNRFGNAQEIGIYEMVEKGLKVVDNPSGILVSSVHQKVPGVAISCIKEGSRSILIEVQALVSPTPYATPQRTSTGYDAKRLQMMLAILDKKCNIKTAQFDVFINLAGGLKTTDTSIDLAICAAIYSSYYDTPLPEESIFVGEVGLIGEIRKSMNIESRIKESQKLGFKNIYCHLEKNENSKTNNSVRNFGYLMDFLGSIN